MVVNNLIWIDEAFSKDYVDELEASCCLTEGQNKVYFGDKVSSYFVDYEIHPHVRRMYNVIITWNFSRRCLFDFINRAIAKNLQNFRRELLLEKCAEIFLNMPPDDKGKFISDYFYISQELELITNSTIGSESNLDQSQKTYPWVPYAIAIYKELLHKNQNLSVERMSMLIHEEMKKKLLDGNKEMAKRGGKLAPSADSIARHALQNLN